MGIDTSSIDRRALTCDVNVDYMAVMLEASTDGSEEALLKGAVAEMQRNLKIRALSLGFETTSIFEDNETAEEIAALVGAYIAERQPVATDEAEPPQPEEPEQVEEKAAQYYTVTASSLNVRSGPGTEHKRIGSFSFGTVVTALDTKNGWIQVTNGGTTGWCLGTYLKSSDGTQDSGSGNAGTSYTDDDLYWLALCIQVEAGSNWLTDEHQLLVGNVVLNRVASSRYPGTIYDVLHQAGQYPWAGRGVSVSISDRAYANARRLLDGERFCPDNVIYQSTATQGSGVFTSIYDSTLKTTTYFCYL